MDQIKIGKFIADCRKNKGITQEQLAEKLEVTSRSISRWENGNTMPDYSLLKELCNELDINVNELLSGERIKEGDYTIKAEENFINLKKKVDRTLKLLNILSYASVLLMIFVWAMCILLNKYYDMTYSSEEIRYILWIFYSFCLFISAMLKYEAKK